MELLASLLNISLAVIPVALLVVYVCLVPTWRGACIACCAVSVVGAELVLSGGSAESNAKLTRLARIARMLRLLRLLKLLKYGRRVQPRCCFGRWWLAVAVLPRLVMLFTGNKSRA